MKTEDMWRVAVASFLTTDRYYCARGPGDPDAYDADRCWPTGRESKDFVTFGVAITMCDVFNLRDFGKLNKNASKGVV